VDVIEKLFTHDEKIDETAPAVIAVIDKAEQSIERRDFKRRARSFAKAIDKLCAKGERVAILLPQGGEAYAAEIGALYAGRSFCPLETNYPADRIDYCLSDLAPRLLLTDEAGAEATKHLGITTIVSRAIDNDELLAPQSGDNAYVIYTSGSTGRPKGVEVPRRSMNKFLDWSWKYYGAGPGDRWAQFSSLGFDLSLVDLLTALPVGAALLPVTGLDRVLPGRFIQQHKISVWHSVPSLVPLLLKEEQDPTQLATLRTISFCGEPLYPQQVQRLSARAPSAVILNTYGPTEGTFFCSVQAVDAELCVRTKKGSLPIGHPIPGWTFDFVETDEKGLHELVIVSANISRGYITDTPDKTKFNVNDVGVPTYQTGDLVRREGDDVFFVRRNDSQIKIKGNRLDLTEVEFHALAQGVVEAKAFLLDETVYVAVDLGPTSRAALERTFKANLPRYAVPADIFERSPLPKNANEKIDTAALRAIAQEKWGHRNGG
jgi:D-alanine--poly(phosphoribitol) ligase subunit 1